MNPKCYPFNGNKIINFFQGKNLFVKCMILKSHFTSSHIYASQKKMATPKLLIHS